LSTVSSAGGMGRGPDALCLRGERAPSWVRVRVGSPPRSPSLPKTGKLKPGSPPLPAPPGERNAVVAAPDAGRSRRRSAIAPPQSSASNTSINASVMSSSVEGSPGSEPDSSGSWRAGFGRAEASTVPRVKSLARRLTGPADQPLRTLTSPNGTCLARGSALTTGAPASWIDTLSSAAIRPFASTRSTGERLIQSFCRALGVSCPSPG
jgi:hypothetical protein